MGITAEVQLKRVYDSKAHEIMNKTVLRKSAQHENSTKLTDINGKSNIVLEYKSLNSQRIVITEVILKSN